MLRPSELNVPVTMSGCPVTVHPGDIIVGDQDGVVCVPQNLIDQVVASCDKYVAIDNQCMEDISKGKGVQETFAKYRGSK
jgi:regulator of RNase E activity RraA